MKNGFVYLAAVVVGLSAGCKSPEQPRPATSQARPEPIEVPAVRRPRSLAEARSRLAMSVGPDRSAGPFRSTTLADYDAQLVAEIKTRWYKLLDARPSTIMEGQRGKVVVRFALHPDGRVSNVEIAETEVRELLGVICQAAILEGAPFNPWPQSMRREIQAGQRRIQFTFYYY